MNASLDADELVKAVTAGLTEGVSHTQFPMPGQLKGTLGVRLENGRTFASHAELQQYWTTGDGDDMSDTDSEAEDDWEALQQVQVTSVLAPAHKSEPELCNSLLYVIS